MSEGDPLVVLVALLILALVLLLFLKVWRLLRIMGDRRGGGSGAATHFLEQENC